jgi:NitT/TauT family transport system substrate-binding protein
MELRPRSFALPTRWLGLLAAMSLVLSACASTPASSPSGPPASVPASAPGASATAAQPSSPGGTTDVTFITDFLLWGWHSPYFAGVKEGFFQDEGLNVSIQGGKGSVDTATQLANGTVDFGLIDISTALKAMSAGANFKLIGVHLERYPGGFLFIKENTTLADWKDFEGLKLGAAATDAYLTALPGLMTQNGADPSKYTLVTMEAAATTGALISGQVDAIPGSPMTAPPRAAAAAEQGLTLDRFGFADHGFDGMGFAIATTTAHYENDKDLVQHFVNGWAKAMLWSNANTDQAVADFIAANPEKNTDQETQSLQAGMSLTPTSDGTYFLFDDSRMAATIDFVNQTYGTTFDGSNSYTNEFVNNLPAGYTDGSM